jgi:hypothetical protein
MLGKIVFGSGLVGRVAGGLVGWGRTEIVASWVGDFVLTGWRSRPYFG